MVKVPAVAIFNFFYDAPSRDGLQVYIAWVCLSCENIQPNRSIVPRMSRPKFARWLWIRFDYRA